MLAARIPALLVAGATVAITALHAKSLTNKRTALLAGLVLASSLEFFRYTKTVSLDLVLTLCLTATVALIARPNARTKHIYLAAIPLALALLTKPFVGLLAAPPLALWLLSQKNTRALIHLFLSALLAGALAAPWHIAMFLKHGQPFLDEYIGSQALARITTGAHGSSPWFHYLQIAGESYWPWLIPALLACIAFARGRTYIKDKPAVTLALIWCAFWLVVLSVSTDKSGRYLVPIYPFAAILCATWLASFFNHKQFTTLDRTILPITAALAFAASASNFIPSLVVHAPASPDKESLYDFLRAHPATDPRFVMPGAKRLNSELFLATGDWPSFINAANQPTGGIIIYRSRTKADPPSKTAILFENPSYTVARLATATAKSLSE
jgi:4-amino-4-deoxy-L-arabinose transferase-like glycosyltransferase